MRLARYVAGGRVEIVEEPSPKCPPGGLVVQTLACGLCSGELMGWYMDAKVPHVLGHEVSGRVVESQSPAFPVGTLVAPHHHAPCLACRFCNAGDYVHCHAWKSSRLVPGGMADTVAVPSENLTDTLACGEIRPIDAALVEPLGCVCKMIRRSDALEAGSVAVVGLGFMGLCHAMVLPGCKAYETNPARRLYAQGLGIEIADPDSDESFDLVIVCPSTSNAVRFGASKVRPGGRLGLFSPVPSDDGYRLPINDIYFREITLVPSYSCGPQDTKEALRVLSEGKLRAEQVVSDFITLDCLPTAYNRMKAGEIIKPMVVWE